MYDMWQKWGNQSTGPTIGAPSLLDTTVQGEYLETIPEVDSIKSTRSSNGTTLSNLAYRTVPPAVQYPHQRKPAWEQDSSGDYGTYPEHDPREVRHSYTEISPISAPRRSWGGQSIDETPISPIEPLHAPAVRAPLPEQQFTSHIPRKVAPVVAASVSVPTEEKQMPISYATLVSAPAPADLVKPLASNANVLPLEQQYPQLKERTKQILAGLREREQASRPGWRKPPATNGGLGEVSRKEPWKGASGRTAIVDPVEDTPSARDDLIHAQGIASGSHHTAMSQSNLSVHSVRAVASQESIKPVAPLKITIRSRVPTPLQVSQTDEEISPDIPTAVPKTLQSPFSSPQPPRSFEDSMPMSRVRTNSPQYDPEPPTPRTPTPERLLDSAPKAYTSQSEHEVSRFSWTTYATSVTDSPRSMAQLIRHESPPPPIPALPQMRKRQISEKYNEGLYTNAEDARSRGSIVARKPVPGKSEGDKSRASTEPTPSILTTSKTLPALPPELESTDKFITLESQLEALSRRKYNINRIIKDLNENLKKNPINFDLKKRREVEQKVQSHETELQEITNQEHEIGLRLRRVQKKRDRDDNYEHPTGLWIKRVTS